MSVYCQTHEEDVLARLFKHLGEGTRTLVDLGAGDGRSLSNTRLLLDQGWWGLRVDLVDAAGPPGAHAGGRAKVGPGALVGVAHA